MRRAKPHGISIIIVDMRSKGVTTRPIPTYYGTHSFNEVFFTDVRVPAENLVGEENRGWYQLMQSLAFERGVALGSSGRTRRIMDKLALIGSQILGAYSQMDPLSTDSKWTRLRGAVETYYHFTPGMATAAGTTDTMRNIVGQFGLQLPKSY